MNAVRMSDILQNTKRNLTQHFLVTAISSCCEYKSSLLELTRLEIKRPRAYLKPWTALNWHLGMLVQIRGCTDEIHDVLVQFRKLVSS